MKVFKVILLSLISIIIVLTSWLCFLTTGVEMTVLSHHYYATLLVEKKVAQDMHGEIGNMLPDLIAGQAGEDAPDEGNAVITQAVTDAIVSTFDVLWLEQTLPPLFDNMIKYVKGQHDTLTLTIDLSEQNESFQEALKDNITAYAEDMPIIFDTDLTEIDFFSDQLTQEINLPDEIDLSDMLSKTLLTEQSEQGLEQFRQIRIVYLIVPYVVVALLLLFCCLLSKLGGGFKWFGTSLLVGSLLFIAGLLIVRLTTVPILLQGLQHNLPVDLSIIETAIFYALDRVLIIPAATVGIGVLFLVIGIIIKRHKVKKASDASAKKEAASSQ